MLILLLANTVQRGGGISFPWIQFYLRGKESGFRLPEISALHQLVKRVRLRDPVSVFWSTKSLLMCIASTEQEYQRLGTIEDRQNALFLRKLYNFINRTEYKKRTARHGLRSTRDIPPKHHIKIFLDPKNIKDAQGLQSYIVELRPRYIAIAHPAAISNEYAQELKLTGQEVIIQFIYKGDAQYIFPTRILGDFRENDINILHITHSRKLTRQQLRKEVRRSLNVSGEVFFISEDKANANETPENMDGYRCQIVNISERGLAIIVGGHIAVEQALKIQFTYNDIPIIYLAQVIDCRGEPNKEYILARLKATTPSVVMRNRISSIVYDIPSIGALNERRSSESRRRSLRER